MSKFIKMTVVLMLSTVFSKILGFLRDIILVYIYGTSTISDIYITASSIPGILFASFGVAISNAFIPLYNEIDVKSRKKSLDFTNNVLNINLFISIFLTIVSIIFTEELVKIFAMNFTGEKLSTTIKFTRIMLIGVLFIGINNIIISWLQLKNKFILSNLSGVPYNIILIISIFISSFTNPIFMAIGNVIAMFAQFLFLLLFSIRNEYRYKLYINFEDIYLKKMLMLVLPVFIGTTVNQINSIIDRSLASTFEVGTITILNSANKLNGFIMAIFISTIASVIYPILSEKFNNQNNEDFREIISKSIISIIILILPVSIFFITLAQPIVKVVFERGAFDSLSSLMTSQVLACYSIGMLSFGLREVLNKVFFSIQDTKTPMINSSISIIMNIVLNLYLSKKIGYIGIPLATSISSLFGVLILFIILRIKIGYLDENDIIKIFIKSLLSSLFMCIIIKINYKLCTYLLGFSFVGQIASLMLTLVIGIITYISIMLIFNVYEVRYLFNKIVLIFKVKL